MEGKKQVGSSSSSFTTELFGSKDSSSSSGIFGSIFPPPSNSKVYIHTYIDTYIFHYLLYWITFWAFYFFGAFDFDFDFDRIKYYCVISIDCYFLALVWYFLVPCILRLCFEFSFCIFCRLLIGTLRFHFYVLKYMLFFKFIFWSEMLLRRHLVQYFWALDYITSRFK